MSRCVYIYEPLLIHLTSQNIYYCALKHAHHPRRRRRRRLLLLLTERNNSYCGTSSCIGVSLHSVHILNWQSRVFAMGLLTVCHSSPIVFHSCTKVLTAREFHVAAYNWAQPDRQLRQPYPLVRVGSRRVKLQENTGKKHEDKLVIGAFGRFLYYRDYEFSPGTKLINSVRFGHKRHVTAFESTRL